jgi:hypothetical protein
MLSIAINSKPNYKTVQFFGSLLAYVLLLFLQLILFHFMVLVVDNLRWAMETLPVGDELEHVHPISKRMHFLIATVLKLTFYIKYLQKHIVPHGFSLSKRPEGVDFSSSLRKGNQNYLVVFFWLSFSLFLASRQ